MNNKSIPKEIAEKYDLVGKLYGKCTKCGAWTSTHDIDKHVEGFLFGCQIDGIWFCNLCLPCQHTEYFD